MEEGKTPNHPPLHALVPDVRRRLLPSFVLALAAALLGTLAAVAPAAADTEPCAKAVVADWYGDGRVDKVFPLDCYRQAIRSLPVDVLDYSHAKQDILRALAFARKGAKDPGPSGTEEPTGVNNPSDPVDPGQVEGPGGEPGGAGEPGQHGRPGQAEEPGGQPTHPGDPGTDTTASGPVDTSGPSSLPIPLLILGGLALLLLAAGAAGYLNRRAHGDGDDGPPNTV